MLRIRQIKIEVNQDNIENLTNKVLRKLKISRKDLLSLKIHKKSIDARKKDFIFYVYDVDIEVRNEESILKRNPSIHLLKVNHEKYLFPTRGDKLLKKRPIIVGSGPGGLFCAYLLAEQGYRPLIIERGERLEDRVHTVEHFFKTGILNKNSNVQFGEGGAGTFSDGKLNTLTKDKFYRSKKVFSIFVENGAPEEILYLNKPHIGTDLLRNVIINIRNKIISMGGEFRYNTKLTNLVIEGNKIKQIEVNDREIIDCECLVLAIGHSARDTYEMLYSKKLSMSPKPFAVGIRIQHSRNMIDQSQYGNKYNLSSASYKLTYNTKEKRGVYTFCMCPGGYVVDASSEENMLAINGMSNYKRDGINSNSAIVVTVSPKDYGTHPLDGISFQRNLEKKAYQVGNGKIPTQLYKDFKENKVSSKFHSVEPSFMGNYHFSNLNEIFPPYVRKSLIEAIEYYGKRIEGFSRDDAILAAVESRTSSPVRIERNDLLESNIKGIYPCGEGAGYSGGITTSAIDGIKVSEKIVGIYKGIRKIGDIE